MQADENRRDNTRQAKGLRVGLNPDTCDGAACKLRPNAPSLPSLMRLFIGACAAD
jgi:hypothetical protein